MTDILQIIRAADKETNLVRGRRHDDDNPKVNPEKKSDRSRASECWQDRRQDGRRVRIDQEERKARRRQGEKGKKETNQILVEETTTSMYSDPGARERERGEEKKERKRRRETRGSKKPEGVII